MEIKDERLERVLIAFFVEQRWKRWLWIIALLVVVCYVFYLLRAIWMPLIIAFLIAMVLDPVVDKLEMRGWSRLKGTILIYALFLGTVGIGSYLAVPAIVHQSKELNKQIDSYIPDRSPAGIDKALKEANVADPVRVALVNASEGAKESVDKSIGWLNSHAMEIAGNLIWIVIIPIVAFYALKDFHIILAKGLLLVPRHKREFAQTLMADISVVFAKYMRGMALLSAMNGAATWLMLFVLGVPNAFMIGLIAGVLYSVPYIGAIITTALIGLVSFLHGGFQFSAIVILVSLVLHQIVFDYIITPRVLGQQVGLHPILAIIALLSGNVLFGLIGMILAVPVAASIQITILALTPKLRLGVDVNAPPSVEPDTVEGLAAGVQEEHIKIDATEELHRSITETVDHLEAQMLSDQEAKLEAESEPKPE